MRPNPVKQALKAGRPSVGTWLSLGSITASRFLARSRLRLADRGHRTQPRRLGDGHAHVRLHRRRRLHRPGARAVATATTTSSACSTTAPTASSCRWSTAGRRRRPPSPPAKYPPTGNRSVGGSVHALNFQTSAVDYFAHANEEMLVVLQCEHIQSVENADAIFSVPGIDAIFVGPNDLAASMRGKDGKPPSGEATTEAMKHILATCRKHGVAPGMHCMNAEEAKHRIEEGWQFVAVISELKMMLNGMNDVVQKLGLRGKAETTAKY